MAKQEVLIQMIVDGRPAWQVRREVARELCRKMTNEELKRIGNDTINALELLIDAGASPSGSEVRIPIPEPAARKSSRR